MLGVLFEHPQELSSGGPDGPQEKAASTLPFSHRKFPVPLVGSTRESYGLRSLTSWRHAWGSWKTARCLSRCAQGFKADDASNSGPLSLLVMVMETVAPARCPKGKSLRTQLTYMDMRGKRQTKNTSILGIKKAGSNKHLALFLQGIKERTQPTHPRVRVCTHGRKILGGYSLLFVGNMQYRV